MSSSAAIRIESASRPGLMHTVRLGRQPSCTCEAFQFGSTNPCKHIRIARIREAKQGSAGKASAYRSIATTPTESPAAGRDDSLKGALEGMDLDARVAAIERMAKSMGV